jgi:outer membrane protein, multidrug efflux system
VLNVERSRALYHIQRAAQLPAIEASGAFERERLPPALSEGVPSATYQYYEAGVGLASFEIDLFGHVRSLSHVALQEYLSQQETRRAVHSSA